MHVVHEMQQVENWIFVSLDIGDLVQGPESFNDADNDQMPTGEEISHRPLQHKVGRSGKAQEPKQVSPYSLIGFQQEDVCSFIHVMY